MRASPFLKPLEAEALDWEALLVKTQVCEDSSLVSGLCSCVSHESKALDWEALLVKTQVGDKGADSQPCCDCAHVVF